MKLYTVTIHNMRMCMMEDNSGSNYFKENNWLRKIISSVGWGVSFSDLTHSSSYVRSQDKV